MLKLTKTLLAGSLAVTGLGLAVPMANAAPIVLDFDDPSLFTHGTFVDDEYESTYGVSIFGTNFQHPFDAGDSAAVIFDSNRSPTQDPDLEAPFYENGDTSNPGYYPGNLLIIQEHPEDCNSAHTLCTPPDDEGRQSAGEFLFTFVDPVTVLSLTYFDVESAENSNHPDSEVLFFDSDGNQIGSAFYAPNAGGDNGWALLGFGPDGVAGVSSMIVELRGSGGIDSLVYAPVPIPPAIALFVVGLAGLFGFRRRRTT